MTENQQEIEKTKDQIAQLQTKLSELEQKSKPSKEEINKIVDGNSRW